VSDVAITVENLSKAYRIGLKEEVHRTLTAAGLSWVKAPVRNFNRLRRLNTFAAGFERGTTEQADVIWALRDVSLEIRRGEVVGIIGRNGAGKSTLLKILSRIARPTRGRAVIHGRVSSLLEVGTGFHGELTGRENVYLNGTILGMRKHEIDRKFDEIVDFSGVEKFIDTPVKRYSSGMTVRLAFAVAAHLDPDILIIDEVLAVGDAAFQKRCLGKIHEVATGGRTVLFVSHNMAGIQHLCPRSMWLDNGVLRGSGPSHELVRAYLADSSDPCDSPQRTFPGRPTQAVQLMAVTLCDSFGSLRNHFSCDDAIRIRLTLEVRKLVPGLYGYVEFQRSDGITVMCSDSFDTNPNPLDGLTVGSHDLVLEVPARVLGSGDYAVYLNLTSIMAEKFNVDSPGVVGRFQLSDHNTRRGNARPGFVSAVVNWKLRGPSDERRALSDT